MLKNMSLMPCEKKIQVARPEKSKVNKIEKYLNNDCYFKKWSEELKIISKKEFIAGEWDILSHGLIIISNDLSEAEEAVKEAAKLSGFKYLSIEKNEILTKLKIICKNTKYKKPTIVYLEPGKWLLNPNEEESHPDFNYQAGLNIEEAQLCKINLSKYLINKSKSMPVIFVTACIELKQIDKVLKQESAFDRSIKLCTPTPEQKSAKFIKEIGEAFLDPNLLIPAHRLGTFLINNYQSSKKLKLMQKAARRLAHRERRLIGMNDLIRFATYGTTETDQIDVDKNTYYRTAVHEAGHALIMILNSKGEIFPDYLSIIGHSNSLGVTVFNNIMRYDQQKDSTYIEKIHLIRALLGGRVAEHLILGINNISSEGSRTDLEYVTREVWEIIGRNGLPSLSRNVHDIGGNAFVIVGTPSNSEYLHFENLAREFISMQYKIVLKKIKSNIGVFEIIVENLLKKYFLDHDEISEIFKSYHLRND